MRQGREAHRGSCNRMNIRRENEPHDTSAHTTPVRWQRKTQEAAALTRVAAVGLLYDVRRQHADRVDRLRVECGRLQGWSGSEVRERGMEWSQAPVSTMQSIKWRLQALPCMRRAVA